MSRPEENLTREDARRRADLLADLAYEIALDVRSTEHVSARSTVTFRCSEPGASTFLDVTADHIDRAELNGRPVDLSTFTGTRVRLDDLAVENTLLVEARHTYSNEGTGVHTFVDPVDDERYLYTQAEPNHAHNIYPCFDQPDLKATFRFEITAPARWVVVSNSPRDGDPHLDGDDATWRFDTTPVMSPYITAFCAGPYHEVREMHGDIDLGVLCRQTLSDHLEADEILEVTRQGLDLFPQLFGAPYVWGKYDQIFVPEFAAGAMENAGCVTFNEIYLFRSKVTEAERLGRAEVILHEMAHMWFGDLVTMRWWDDLWLNESFATYASFYAMEKATRFADGAWVNFNDELKAWAVYQDQLPTTHPIEADLPDVAAVHQNFDGITYAKGASVLRQLAAYVGEDAFFEGCASYFEDHAYDNATLGDFLGALEKASGRDLGTWADTWLRTAGINTIGLDVEVDGDRYTSVAVRQTAPEDLPTLRPHRLRIGVFRLHEGELVRDQQVELDVAGGRTQVPDLAGVQVADLLLPNDDDLAYTKLRLDDGALDTLSQHLAVLRDPLARALAWSAAWDMVRDAELPARRYVDLVHGNAHGEGDVGLLQTLLGRARTATDLYGDPANWEPQTAAMHQHARTALTSSDAGSDHQLAWARHWAATARSADETAEVRAVLDGELAFDGLPVDTELAWHLIGALVSAGAADDEVVERQLEQDPTDLGRRHAARVRASRPDAQAKETAWQLAAEGHDLSHSVADAVARGWRQTRQPDLIADFVDRYFEEALPRFWAERSVDRAIALTWGFYPLPVVSQDVLDATDRALDGGLPPGAVRSLREQRDSLRRALAARACDGTTDVDS